MRVCSVLESLAKLRWLLVCVGIVGTSVGCGSDDAPELADDRDHVRADDDDQRAGEDRDQAGKDRDASRRGPDQVDAGSEDEAAPAPEEAPPAKARDAGAAARPDAGVDGGARDASAPHVDAASEPAYCRARGNEIAILGDSYVQLSGDFTRLLQEKARAAGALGANETYVDHALSGASMNGFPSIPSQFPDAVADAKRRRSQGIRILIMTGGGNDVLVGKRSCLEFESLAAVEQNDACVNVMENTCDTAQKLFDDGVEEGLEAIVYFFYPHLPKSSAGAGPNANNILDDAVPKMKALCDAQTKAPCFFVDMRPAFDDPSNPGWPREGLIGFDGIHPTLKGSQILADEVWKVMQAHCVATKT
ncbi:MAG TPA: SGNH/GDSL hydrolase family protein [Polyangiales bacterium]